MSDLAFPRRWPLGLVPLRRPWLIRERSMSVTPERHWPERKWWDRLALHIQSLLTPAAPMVGAGDFAFARRVMRRGRAFADLSDGGLTESAKALRPRLLHEGFGHRACIDAFALTREAAFRVLGFRHHPVQIIGARHILQGDLVEMATGEGKTATTVLAAAAAALAGIPVHVMTVNEYLRERDYETLAPIYALLGLSSAQVDPEMEAGAKLAAYAAAICHVTHKTLVFDYMRARLGQPELATVQRFAAARITGGATGPGAGLMPPALGFAIVDEADSVLIDEAQTPLIIAAPENRTRAEDCAMALEVAAHLRSGAQFTLRADARRIDLTESGKTAVSDATARNGGLWEIPRAREELVVQALSALHLYKRDQHYILADGKVQIVDEFTGRVLADRQWQSGLHQMIETREGLEISAERNTLAQITFQEFFRRYLWFGGMSGTLAEVARECRRVYGRPVTRVPTNRRNCRRDLGTRLFLTEAVKLAAIAARAERMVRKKGRPVLIGTRSVEVSERLSALLQERGVTHRVLNARQDADEADIIATAGEAGRITIATNMAGRGTDIKIGPEARRAGGLHVILTEFHESRRVDRQLFGRAGRQGDPGSIETMAALGDQVLRRFAPSGCALVAWLVPRWGGRLPGFLAGLLRRQAQARAERLAARNRAATLRRSDSLRRMLAFTGRSSL
ncbi:MAG: translocase [Pseudorhodobacter sp.]